MKYISLQNLVDDILLLIRNNNISESEDLSRAQIILWIAGHRKAIWKEKSDAVKDRYKSGNFNTLEDLVDDEVLSIKEVELDIEPISSSDDSESNTKKSTETLDDVFNNHGSSILSIHDESGEVIQYMDHVRRRYQYYRKYTFGDMTGYFKDDKHIYIQGLTDMGMLKHVRVLYIAENNDGGTDDEDDPNGEEDIKIPAWMVPGIKDRIIKNELAFMLNRPSDDSNNATLASVKPHGPQDDEE